MNERIDALFIKAMNAIPEHLEFNIPKEFTEKFAKLIVQECASLVVDDDNAYDILKQFGVEE